MLDRRVFSTVMFSAGVLPQLAWAQADAAQSEDARLTAFFRKADDQRLELSPETMTFRGIKKRYNELDDHSRNLTERSVELFQAQVVEMKKGFDRARLSPAARLSCDVFERLAIRRENELAWYWQSYAVTSGGTSLDSIPAMLITRHGVSTTEDAEAYVERLRAMERVAGHVAAEVDKRASEGLLPPVFVFGRVIPDVENQIKGAPFDSGPDQAVWADFKKKVASLVAMSGTKARLLAAGQSALLGEWRRGYLRYLQALAVMSKKARANDGVWALPDGDTYYADMVRYHTTTNLAPDEVHQIGLSETARLRTEMRKVKEAVGFRGSLEDFQDHIRADPQFRYPSSDAGRDECLADAKKRVRDYMAVAKAQFLTLPTDPLEVRRVEAFRERTGPIVPAYRAGAPGQSGIVYFNLSDMSHVLKPQLPALTFHEGAPGHHFQLSRQAWAGRPA